MTKGYLILETGECFIGEWIGAVREVEGEVVFHTGMTGYQEIVTHPSNAGHIVFFSYPIIGNYGIQPKYMQSENFTVSAVLISDHCNEPSHYLSDCSLDEALKRENIPGLKHIDTRSLMLTIRKKGTMKGKIVKEKPNRKVSWKQIDTPSLVKSVSVEQIETYGAGDRHIVIVDFGDKKTPVSFLLDNQNQVSLVPCDTSFDEIEQLNPDGIIISNGPGNPEELVSLCGTIKKMTEHYPTLGIGLGHQLIALSYGGKTKKMQMGHRGRNHAVKDLRTGRVWITSQNHGFTVIEDSLDRSGFKVRFRNVNDRTVEGITHQRLPIQTVQFQINLENNCTTIILQDFLQQVDTARGKKHVRV